MRIAITGQTYFPGNNGQAIFTIHLAEGLARAGHDVHVITPNLKLRGEHEFINGVHLHKIGSLDFSWIHPDVFSPFLSSGQIKKIFGQYPPDVVHIQDHYFLSRDVARVSKKMGVALIGTNHFLPENLLPYLNSVPLSRKTKISILWDLMLWTYNHLDMVTTPTETAAKILAQQKIHVPVVPISCGVNTNFFHPPANQNREESCRVFDLNPQKILILYVGRLDREKRIDLLIRGIAKIHSQGHSNVDLVIAGQGAAQAELKALARSLHMHKHVHFLGYVPNAKLPLLYQTADLFAMPSPEELQSIATLEAMASARPILAANARALPELVTHRLNGYLFEPGQVDAVAKGMVFMINHRDRWQDMGLASRSRAVAHSLENTIQRYTEMYSKLNDLRKQTSGRSLGVSLKPVQE